MKDSFVPLLSIDSLVSLIQYKQKYCIDKTKVVIDNARNYSTVPKYIKMMLTRGLGYHLNIKIIIILNGL